MFHHVVGPSMYESSPLVPVFQEYPLGPVKFMSFIMYSHLLSVFLCFFGLAITQLLLIPSLKVAIPEKPGIYQILL